MKIYYFLAKSGVLEFKHGEITKTIPITIIDGNSHIDEIDLTQNARLELAADAITEDEKGKDCK